MPGADPNAGPIPPPRRSAVLARLDAYERLVRLDKPIGILLLLWPTLTALWISARGEPTWTQVLVFTLGTVLMRSAGCAINDWADRAFDAQVKRTAARPLAVGEIPAREAVLVAAVLAFCAFLMVLATNRTTILLSLPAVVIAGVYPFFKRFFALPQAFLGIAFSFGIPMAFAAVFDEVPALAWWMLVVNLFWVIAYDTEYAMVDRDDDVKLGLRTSAITFGRFDVAAVMLCYAIYLCGMVVVGLERQLGPLYYAGLAGAAGCALWHGWLIRGRDRMRCFTAFLHNHWLGFAVFAGVAADFAARLHTWPRGI
jgi:4-hydroxybenzoate polyprenyltransferase